MIKRGPKITYLLTFLLYMSMIFFEFLIYQRLKKELCERFEDQTFHYGAEVSGIDHTTEKVYLIPNLFCINQNFKIIKVNTFDIDFDFDIKVRKRKLKLASVQRDQNPLQRY